MNEIMTVSTKGQITLPSRVRANLGIKTGDRIIGEETPEGFVIKKPRDFSACRGSLRGGKIPADEEELLSPAVGKRIMRRA
jgi:AbrB family looped-hinge helix DNA binding protein